MIRKILFNLLGFKLYLRLISQFFLQTWLSGLRLKAHQQLFMLPKLVAPGDVCIDVGANLGYFTVPLARLAGPKGKVLAVEPVELFREVLHKNIKQFTASPKSAKAEVLPYALGETDYQQVELGTPKVAGVVRHGRTEVLTGERIHEGPVVARHKATIMSPKTLFAKLVRLNFVKIDVEGYELHIVPHMRYLFKRFKPIIEIEIGDNAHLQQISAMLLPLGYLCTYAEGGQLVKVTDTAQVAAKVASEAIYEFYFIPENHTSATALLKT